MEEAQSSKVSPEIELAASQAAKEKAESSKWNLDIAVFLFAVLIIIIILLFEDIGLGVVAPVAVFGLGVVWLVGWRRGKQLYNLFYKEELTRLERASKERGRGTSEKTLEETIEEKIQKALRERWK